MKNLSFKAKIISLCVALSSVSVFVGIISFFALKKVSFNYEHVAYTNLPNIKAVDEMLLNFRLMRLEIGLMVLPDTPRAELDKSVAHIKGAIETYAAAKTKYLEAEYSPGVPFGPGEEAIFNQVDKEWNELLGYKTQALELLATGKPADREQTLLLLKTKIADVAERYAKSTSELRAWNDAQAVEWVGKATSASQNSNVTILLVVVIGTCASLAFGSYFAISLSKSIGLVVNDLAAGASEVLQASHQIATASEQLSQAATEQAASLEETAASVEEMNSMISRNSENASATEQSSLQSQKKVNQGKAIVEKMNQAMLAISASNDSIASQVNHSNESVAGIIKVMERIDKETKVIDEIVNKTELLSFNASVEAARAGEHGKGFAVVAEEVGNLARMSGAAAEKIKVMLEESVTKVEEIVAETKTSIDRLVRDGKQTIENGTDIARQCGEVFEDVVQNVTSVSSMAAEIATASQEQSRGVAEITKAMSLLDQMTQQNAAASEQCASSAEELSSQATSLNSSVVQLTSTMNGQAQQHSNVPTTSVAKPQPSVSREPKVTKSATVVNLKSQKSKLSPTSSPPLKKASGAAPDYNSDGFKDV